MNESWRKIEENNENKEKAWQRDNSGYGLKNDSRDIFNIVEWHMKPVE